MSAESIAGLAAAGAVLVLAGAHRPRVPRRPAVRRESEAHHAGAVAVVGRVLRSSLRRTPDPSADRRVGRVALAALAAALVEPVASVLLVAGAVVWAAVRGRRRAQRHQRALLDELPEVVDLLCLAASSGLTVPLSLGVVHEHGEGAIAASFGRALEVARRGGSLADALEDTVVPMGDEVRGVVRVLAAAMRDGTSVVPSLERLAAEVRTDRRRAAEERARRLPVRLLFPLVVCILPAFALLTVVPLLAGALGGLSL